MTTALRGSVSILMWSTFLLFFLHLVLAILINQILRELYFEQATSLEGKALVYEYFGSFSRAVLTMFELTLANWPTASRVLVENVHESFIIYAILHKMILGFAVVGVVNGVFTQEIFKIASLDDVVMVRRTALHAESHRHKMHRLFAEADVDKNGWIDLPEWQKVCEDEWVRLWLSSQGICAKDATLLFQILDDGDGKLTANELVDGAANLKGTSVHIHMMKMLGDLQSLVIQLKGGRSR